MEGGTTVSEPLIVDRAEIARPARLERAWFSAGGRVIDDLGAVLGAFGVPLDGPASASIPEVVNRAVQKSPTGVIQDPAGSAVGSRALVGGGASGAVYRTFADLLPIPKMAVGAAVFNRTTGPGRRVLHTYSPTLHGDPEDGDARATALVALVDAYANALFALADRAEGLGADGEVCNLVPIAGAIFAGDFRRGRYFAGAHLDPSYSLVAIVVAVAYVRAHGAVVPPLTLCYFEQDVAQRAVEVREALLAIVSGG